jgi:hypothetical protein
MVRVTVPIAPRTSRAVSVMTCVPGESALVTIERPVPITPSMLLDHVSAAPASIPSS